MMIAACPEAHCNELSASCFYLTENTAIKSISESVSETNFDISSVEIYYDPSSDFLHINISSEMQVNGLIEIYDIAGNKVFLEEINSGKQAFILNNLPEGEYIAKISVRKEIKTKKFLKS
jgi:hypothetical protein